MVELPWEYEWSSAREHVGFNAEIDAFTKGEGNKSVDRRQEPVSPRFIPQGSSISGAEKGSEGNDLSSQVSVISYRSIPLCSLKDLDLNWNVEGWREFLGFPDEDDFLSRIRGNTFSGKPLFAEELVAGLEKKLGVPLGSKPKKIGTDSIIYTRVIEFFMQLGQPAVIVSPSSEKTIFTPQVF